MTTALRRELPRTSDLHGRNFVSTIKDNDIVLLDFGRRCGVPAGKVMQFFAFQSTDSDPWHLILKAPGPITQGPEAMVRTAQ
ncbi:hypothetical protein ASG92_13685 [Arthrobacter sp. Soil736]|nr:hypothetical protein ASG92_13685 [Arthrobacter sp. Soil736]